MKRVRWLLWAALGMAAIGLFAAQRLGAATRSERGNFGRVPSFTLTNQLGKPVSDRDLRGQPFVANFIFTRCPTACPLLSAKFKLLQEEVAPGTKARFVSISVDPEHDTPAVLADYGRKYDADPARWWFLTGPLDEIEKTVVAGFKIHIGKPTPNAADPTLIDIMHGEHFVLVDASGVIRGYYRAEEAEMAELIEDLEKLAPG
jgi:protein SCO1